MYFRRSEQSQGSMLVVTSSELLIVQLCGWELIGQQAGDNSTSAIVHPTANHSMQGRMLLRDGVSISCLMMTWRRQEPGHQQTWYWLRYLNGSHSAPNGQSQHARRMVLRDGVSISCLMMSWRRQEPGHQQTWYWPWYRKQSHSAPNGQSQHAREEGIEGWGINITSDDDLKMMWARASTDMILTKVSPTEP